MKPEEPPRGGRMLEPGKDGADGVERRPSLPEEPALIAEERPDARPRRTPRKRKKPFVL